MEIKKHPPFKEAMEKILKRFDEGGYGIIITDEEFDKYLSINPPSNLMSYDEFRKLEMDRLQRYQTIELLLEDHNICLMRSRAINGFELLPPKEQIDIAYKKRMAKMSRELKKAMASIVNINHALLSMEEEADRQKKIMRLAFIKAATNKRKIELVAKPEAKKIASGGD